jgi:hypothetical protein
MFKMIKWIFIVVLIIGGLASWDFIPRSWFDQIPTVGKILLVTCAVVFSLLMILGDVLDSGILQRIFKKKKP